MSIGIQRTGSLQVQDNMRRHLAERQTRLAQTQEQIASGKRVIRPSDDPTAASQTERALMRIERIKTEQRMLEMQKSNIAQAESTLGQGLDTLQRVRELVIVAGNGSLDEQQRRSVAQEIKSLRDQLFGLANRQNASGSPLFGGLGSVDVPFVQTTGGVEFRGLAGQASAGEVTLPSVVDGQRTWMFTPLRDGVFDASFGVRNGEWTSSAAVVRDLAQLRERSYQIAFSGPDYTVVDASDPGNVIATGSYSSGTPIEFEGLAITVVGTPADGDRLDLQPMRSIFDALDLAVSALSAPSSPAAVPQAVKQALAHVDAGMVQLQATRGQTGALLNQAERIDAIQSERALLLEQDRSRFEDLDMLEGLSRLEMQQTGYDVALKAYAQLQRGTLFDYLR